MNATFNKTEMITKNLYGNTLYSKNFGMPDMHYLSLSGQNGVMIDQKVVLLSIYDICDIASCEYFKKILILLILQSIL